MKLNKKQRLKGFTLIELIVVIAIIGILTAVLTLNWIAYINDTRVNSANTQARLIYNSAVTVVQDYQVTGRLAPFGSASGAVNVVWNSTDTSIPIVNEINDKYNGDEEGAIWCIGLTINSGNTPSAYTAKINAVTFASNSSSRFIGRYPDNFENPHSTFVSLESCLDE